MPSPSRSLANGVLAPNRTADAMANGAPGQPKRSRRIERLLRAQPIAGYRSRRNRLDQIGVVVVDVAAPADRGGPSPGICGPADPLYTPDPHPPERGGRPRRGISIAGQRLITTLKPAASARAAASSSRTPS